MATWNLSDVLPPQDERWHSVEARLRHINSRGFALPSVLDPDDIAEFIASHADQFPDRASFNTGRQYRDALAGRLHELAVIDTLIAHGAIPYVAPPINEDEIDNAVFEYFDHQDLDENGAPTPKSLKVRLVVDLDNDMSVVKWKRLRSHPSKPEYISRKETNLRADYLRRHINAGRPVFVNNAEALFTDGEQVRFAPRRKPYLMIDFFDQAIFTNRAPQWRRVEIDALMYFPPELLTRIHGQPLTDEEGQYMIVECKARHLDGDLQRYLDGTIRSPGTLTSAQRAIRPNIASGQEIIVDGEKVKVGWIQALPVDRGRHIHFMHGKSDSSRRAIASCLPSDSPLLEKLTPECERRLPVSDSMAFAARSLSR
jgi:hypothetical protein